MRVLLVDDEEEFVTTLAERLAFRGFKVDYAIEGHGRPRSCGKKRL